MDNKESSELPDLWCEAEDHIKHYCLNKAIIIYEYILIRYRDNDVAVECAHARLGNVLLSLGKTAQGENNIRKALDYNPKNHYCHHLLGFVYDQRYQWDGAICEYRKALDLDPSNSLYQRSLGEAVFNSGNKEAGLEYLLEVLPLYPDNSGMLSEVATAYISIGDMISARKYAQEAVRTNPGDIMAQAVLQKIIRKAENSLE